MISLKEKAFNHNNHFIVAIDGPSAAGKGEIGRVVAKEFNLVYFQSSLVYRSLAFMCLEIGVNLENVDKIIALSKFLNILEYTKNIDLNNENIAALASKIAVIKKVRENLSQQLINLIASTPRILMEGRDIGTVIAPNADLKIFITADVETRAKRRYKQLIEEGKKCIMLPQVLKQLKARDLRDKQRTEAPLVPAEDAFIIDSSYLTPEQIKIKILELVNLSNDVP